MANEAVIISLGFDGGNVIRRTCADGTTISKGTLLILSDANLVIASNAYTISESWGGIAAADKLANDGSTTIPVYTSGVFDLTNSAAPAIAVGRMVVMSGANLIRLAVESDFPVGAVLGQIEENASGSEVARVRLRGY